MQEAADPGHVGCTRLTASSDVSDNEQERVVTKEHSRLCTFSRCQGTPVVPNACVESLWPTKLLKAG